MPEAPDLAAAIAAVRQAMEAHAVFGDEPPPGLALVLRVLEALEDDDLMAEVARILMLGKKAEMPWSLLIANNMPAAQSAVANWRRKGRQLRAALLARAGGGG